MGDATRTSGRAGTGTLGIAGIGLIGGSIAAAARSRGLFARVIGFGRSQDRLEAAKRAGLIDDFAVDYERFGPELDLFVSCLPVDRIADSVRRAAGSMSSGAVVTDAGSVKGTICEAVGPEPAPGVTFVGSHPLAGSEKQGFEHANSDLFQGRLCVLTPCGGDRTNATDRLANFWRSLGSEVATLSPGEHDEILARTSHLPHLAASAVAAGVAEDHLRFGAGGFRDTTRVAAGDPALWASILLANRDAVRGALSELIGRCDALRRALDTRDAASLQRMLGDAKARREKFDEVFR